MGKLASSLRRVACTSLLLLLACRSKPVLQRHTVSAAASAPALSAPVIAPALSPSPLDSITLGLEAAGECQPDDGQGWYVRLQLRSPAKQHRAALVALRARLPGALLCGNDDEIYLSLSTAQARELFKAHASFKGLSGAGNTTAACAWFARLSPPNFVPRGLAPHVSELSFDTDPKFVLIHDLVPCAEP